jgi:hypothetical protein
MASDFQLFPHPGCLPSRQQPTCGDRISLTVPGLPPYKDFGASIRNFRHKIHGRFLSLRKVATEAMEGRRWTDGAVSMKVSIFAPCLERGKSALDYVSGIMDTLDGSHGPRFTYLPVVYQDDCQVCEMEYSFTEGRSPHYVVELRFLE